MWYWVKAKIDNKNKKAHAKIWENKNSEPESYQITCDIDINQSTEPLNFHVNGTSSTNLDIITDHLQFTTGEIDSFQ